MGTVLNGYPTTRTGAEKPCDVTTTVQPASDKCLLDVAVKEGTVTSTPGGLSVGGLVTEVAIDAVSWTALPLVPLVGRNGVGVQNPSAVEIKLNFATPGGYIGWRIAANGETFFDIKDTIIVYAKASAGTPTLTIMEVA